MDEVEIQMQTIELMQAREPTSRIGLATHCSKLRDPEGGFYPQDWDKLLKIARTVENLFEITRFWHSFT